MNPLRPHSSPLLGRLLNSLGHHGARTPTIVGGSVRHASTEAVSAADPAATAGVPVPAVEAPSQTKQGGGRRSRALPPPGHGELIWVYNHIVANNIVYSLTPAMKSNKAFRQFAYTGKKLVPAKLRRDYWRPLAVVEFNNPPSTTTPSSPSTTTTPNPNPNPITPAGLVGRSAFQKLRELQRRHQLEWTDASLLALSRRERGKALNDQRGNAVADLAAVLAGRGKGNLVAGEAFAAAVGFKKGKNTTKGGKGGRGFWLGKKAGEAVELVEAEVDGREVGLHRATVYWANEQDKYYAEAWTENVTHVIGLPEREEVVVGEGEEEGVEGAGVEGEAVKTEAA